MSDKSIAEFRRKLIEDPTFRKEFATDPGGTLRSVGVDLPAGANIPPIDPVDLEDRVSRLKELLGADVAKLYDTADVSQVVRDPQRAQRIEELMNFAQRPGAGGALSEQDLHAVSGGMYTISAFGTMDW
jgi:hypothetical protein